jgi:hypothetical protein
MTAALRAQEAFDAEDHAISRAERRSLLRETDLKIGR